MKTTATWLLVLCAGPFLLSCEKKLAVTWSCEPTSKNTAQCRFENKGEVVSEACFDYVRVCGGKDHVASICSGPIQIGGTESKVVREFRPAIGLLDSCVGTEFREKKVFASR